MDSRNFCSQMWWILGQVTYCWSNRKYLWLNC